MYWKIATFWNNKILDKRRLILIMLQEKTIKHNLNWPYIQDHPYGIVMIRGSGSGKANVFLNFINRQPDIAKTYLYAKDLSEAKYQLLINKREKMA